MDGHANKLKRGCIAARVVLWTTILLSLVLLILLALDMYRNIGTGRGWDTLSGTRRNIRNALTYLTGLVPMILGERLCGQLLESGGRVTGGSVGLVHGIAWGALAVAIIPSAVDVIILLVTGLDESWNVPLERLAAASVFFVASYMLRTMYQAAQAREGKDGR